MLGGLSLKSNVDFFRTVYFFFEISIIVRCWAAIVAYQDLVRKRQAQRYENGDLSG